MQYGPVAGEQPLFRHRARISVAKRAKHEAVHEQCVSGENCLLVRCPANECVDIFKQQTTILLTITQWLPFSRLYEMHYGNQCWRLAFYRPRSSMVIMSLAYVCMSVCLSLCMYIFIFIYLFTNDKGRLAPLTCHTVHQTLKSRSNSVNTKARKNS